MTLVWRTIVSSAVEELILSVDGENQPLLCRLLIQTNQKKNKKEGDEEEEESMTKVHRCKILRVCKRWSRLTHKDEHRTWHLRFTIRTKSKLMDSTGVVMVVVAVVVVVVVVAGAGAGAGGTSRGAWFWLRVDTQHFKRVKHFFEISFRRLCDTTTEYFSSRNIKDSIKACQITKHGWYY